MSKYRLHTIGYSGFEPDAFVRALKNRSIKAVADVRTSPYSARYAKYNQDRLGPFLKSHGIFYVFLGKELGARPENHELYTDDGRLDFGRVVHDACFLGGLSRVRKGLERFPLTLMCAEKDPARCHRAILVARAFNKTWRDVEIAHIRPDREDEFQGELDLRVMREENLGEGTMIMHMDGQDIHFPSREQRIEKAYRMRGKEIAFRGTNVDEELL